MRIADDVKTKGHVGPCPNMSLTLLREYMVINWKYLFQTYRFKG